jgi:hypothetical protein
LLIQFGLPLQEHFSGKMVITPDLEPNTTIFALSTSDFTVLPIGTVKAGGSTSPPIAVPVSNTLLLASDQCGVMAAQNSGTVAVRNVGVSRITVSAQVLTSAATQPAASIPGGAGRDRI